MLYVFATYWPFVIAAFAVGLAAGWWYQSPYSVDSVTAWLEGGPDER